MLAGEQLFDGLEWVCDQVPCNVRDAISKMTVPRQL